MSNVKAIDVRFSIPISNCSDKKFLKLLGWCSLPWISSTLKMTAEEALPEPGLYKEGEEVDFIPWKICGAEAVSWDWLYRRLDELSALGAVFTKANVKYIEAPGEVRNLIVAWNLPTDN